MNTATDILALLVIGWLVISFAIVAVIVVGRIIEHLTVTYRRNSRAKAAETASARYLARLRDAGLL